MISPKNLLRNRISYLFFFFLIVVTVVFALPRPVSAIGDPDYVQIGEINIYRNLWESGDQLWFVRYDVSYSSEPSEDAEDTWQMAIYPDDEDGSPVLFVRPLLYYQHNIISIYLTSEQALTWEATYFVRIMGMPSIFDPLTEGVNMRTWETTEGMWHDSGLGAECIIIAKILEDDWGVTLLTSGDLLNTTGATYFDDAIPELDSLYPEIFQVSSATPTVDRATYNRSYAESTESNAGERFRGAMTALGGYFGITEGWMEFWSFSLLALVFGGIVYAGTRHSPAALIWGMPILALAAWMMGGEFLTGLAVLVMVAGIAFGVVFILQRFA